MGPAPAKPPPPIMPPAIIPYLVLHIMPGPGSLVTRPVARSIRSSTAPDACALLADRGVVHGGMMGGLRLRWRIALPLKRFAAPLELLLADLPAGQAPAQGVHRLVAGTRAREGAYRKDDQCSKAAPEQDHHGCHQEPAPAVVVTPHHLAEPPLIRLDQRRHP